MVIAVVSPDVLTHLQNLGCADHDFFMQWLQNDTGVTSTQITDSVYQLQGSWQIVSKVNTMLNKLLTAHKIENMEELCQWLKTPSELNSTVSDMGQKTEPTEISDLTSNKDLVSTGTQTDYLLGMSVNEEMMNAIQEGYTNIIKNATQAAVQSTPTISSPNFAPQINIYTGQKSRRTQGRPRGRPPTKAKLKELPKFPTISAFDSAVTVKEEPEDCDSEIDQDDPGISDNDNSVDEEFEPKRKHRRKSTPVQKVKLERDRNIADASYREKVLTHVSQESEQERNSRIDAFIMVIEKGTKDHHDGYRYGCNACDSKARAREGMREHVQRIHIPAGEYGKIALI